jgi:two-component system, NtrC family, sensor kinase
MVIINTEGQMLLVNSQTEHLFGYPREQLLGQSVDFLLPEGLRHRHRQHRASYVAHPHTRPMGTGLDLVAQHQDGHTFPVEVSLSPLDGPDGLLVTAVIRDSTERKNAADELERQVQQRTAHLNALLRLSQELLQARSLDFVLQRALELALQLVPQATASAVYLFDPADQHLALRASVGFRQLPQLRLPTSAGTVGLAFTTRQVYGTQSAAELAQVLPAHAPSDTQRLHDVFDTPTLPSGTLALPLIAHEQTIGVLLLLRIQGDGPFAADARTTLEGLANIAAAAIWEDQRASEAATTARRLLDLETHQQVMRGRLDSAEAAMMQAARLAAVGQLAAAVAHEINNPLYATRNALYLLEADLPDALRQSPFLQIVREELARIARITERMRDFYRPTRGEMEPHQLNAALEATLALAGLQMRHVPVQLIWTPAVDLPPVICSLDQLRQVFLNLILNALDAMPNGGTLTVRTLAGSTVALVEVQDTGVGIPTAVRERLFEPFFTTKPTGTGLGLSISAHIVTQHGGQIEVESQEGQGSLFRVMLPYAGTT